MIDEAMHTRVVAIARGLMAAGEVPTAEQVAEAAGISRSTYYRLAGGSHQALLREAGYTDEGSARQRILDTTAELLAQTGFSGLLMDTVAVRAGVSRATLYRLFPGKAELLSALTQDRAATASLALALRGVSELPPEEVLPRMIAMVAPRIIENGGIFRAVLSEPGMSSSDHAPSRSVVSTMFGALAVYVHEHMAAGRLRQTDPGAAVQSLMGPILLHAVMRPEFLAESFGEQAPSEVTVQEMVQIWLRGMRPEGYEEREQ